jgi:hypothetical protein
LRDLLVLVRLHAGDPDRADAFVLMDNRQAALDQQAGGEAGEDRPVLDAILGMVRLPFDSGHAEHFGDRRNGPLADISSQWS